MPLELDELLDELDELEDELELEELERPELDELEELEELEELDELELLLELVFSPPQPTNQILLAISARDKTRLCVVDLFINVNHSIFDVLSGDLLNLNKTPITKRGNSLHCPCFCTLRDHRRNHATGERRVTEVGHRPAT